VCVCMMPICKAIATIMTAAEMEYSQKRIVGGERIWLKTITSEV